MKKKGSKSDKKIIGYPYRYDVRKDEYLPYSFKEGEKAVYENTSLRIWGCSPNDVDWAIGTAIYREEAKLNV